MCNCRYRELLNVWQEWHTRSKFDVLRTKIVHRREELEASVGRVTKSRSDLTTRHSVSSLSNFAANTLTTGRGKAAATSRAIGSSGNIGGSGTVTPSGSSTAVVASSSSTCVLCMDECDPCHSLALRCTCAVFCACFAGSHVVLYTHWFSK